MKSEDKMQGKVMWYQPRMITKDSLQIYHSLTKGFPGVSAVKNLPANAGDVREAGLIPRSRKSLEKEMAAHSSNPMDRRAWRATVCAVSKESDST